MPYFFSDTHLKDLVPGQSHALPERVFHHAVRVCRQRVGDTLTLFDGSGATWEVTLTAIARNDATIRVDACPPPLPAPNNSLTLALAAIAADRLDWALQKGTELGVTSFQLLQTERSAPQPRLERRIEHWRGVVIAACEQCQRPLLPEVLPPTPLAEFVRARQGILLNAGARQSLSEALSASPAGSVTVLVGPEGGFSEAEIALATAAGWHSAHLGQRVLRTETAVVAAATLVQAVCGDLK